VTATRAQTSSRIAASWDRARLGIVVPISIIVVVAIICIVIAVLTSAWRADEVALEHEKRLFTRAVVNHGEQILRELESVASAEQALAAIRGQFDHDAVQQNLGLRLRTYFDHDFVFVADGADQLVYAMLGRNSVQPGWFNTILPELVPAIDHIRGRSGARPQGALAIVEQGQTEPRERAHRASLIQKFLGRPAIVAAVLMTSDAEQTTDEDRLTAPVAMSIKFIDEDVLATIAARLQLLRLRSEAGAPAGEADYHFDLKDEYERPIAGFIWTPKRPGSEIVSSVIPFITVAFGGFALLAALVYGYIRRTTATIASGEQRLRYLAMHDSLSGLPNRNYFGEALETAIRNVHRGGPTAAVFYIDLDHFKDVNDTLGHPIGDELIRNVTARLSGTLRPDDLVARLGGDEFAVITTLASDIPTLQRIADRIIAALCAPYCINGHDILIGASIGIAIIGHHAQNDAADILRYGALSRQERGPQPRLHLRRGDERRPLQPQVAGARPAARHRQQRSASALSADRERLRRHHDRRRGAGALVASGARRHRALAIHPDRRAFRPDRRAWRMGAAPCLPRRQELAEPHHGGQRLADPVPPPGFRGRGGAHPHRDAVRPVPARTGTDREHASRQRRFRRDRHAPPKGAR
jgi:diguanylate cyclase (GGDEF)-like protein